MKMSLSLSAESLMVQYAHYHRDRRNIATHLVGIPLIFTAIAMWLVFPLGRQWGAYGITGAWLMWAVTSFWYITRGQPLLGVATALVNGLLVALAHTLVQAAAQWFGGGVQEGELVQAVAAELGGVSGRRARVTPVMMPMPNRLARWRWKHCCLRPCACTMPGRWTCRTCSGRWR